MINTDVIIWYGNWWEPLYDNGDYHYIFYTFNPLILVMVSQNLGQSNIL